MKTLLPPASFPTPMHEAAAEAVTAFFEAKPAVDAVLLICSCARGKATKDSCVDVAVFHSPALDVGETARLQAEWQAYYDQDPVFKDLRGAGAFSHVDLDLLSGEFAAPQHGWTSGADSFELEIGNLIAYSVPMFEKNSRYQDLRKRWLPYYSPELQQERLTMVVKYCLNNLNHVPGFIERELYFQAFDRLYKAFGEFLQALFIKKRTYPISYNKWIKEQIVGILGMPQLYERLPKLFEFRHFESPEIGDKAGELKSMMRECLGI